MQCLDLDSNQDCDLRRVACAPLHHRDGRQPEASAKEELKPLADASDWYAARARGVEPRWKQFWRLPALPGAHSSVEQVFNLSRINPIPGQVENLSYEGVRRDSNPYLLVHSQACRGHYTTDTVRRCEGVRVWGWGVWRLFTAARPQTRTRRQLRQSGPCGNRTHRTDLARIGRRRWPSPRGMTNDQIPMTNDWNWIWSLVIPESGGSGGRTRQSWLMRPRWALAHPRQSGVRDQESGVRDQQI